MATKLEIMIQHALRTFKHSHKKRPDCCLTDLTELKSLTDEITANDINKLGSLLGGYELKDFLRMKRTTLDYLPVYEDDSITVGVFLLMQGAKLPIHDHPNMHGIIKVLKGILKVTSYSVVDADRSHESSRCSPMFYNGPLKVIKHPEMLVTSADECCMLTPTSRNIHEVECVEGPASFLDILSPPYETGGCSEPRTCHYFKEVAPEFRTDDGENCLFLTQVPNPF